VAERYENPPIQEAICEFHFDESASWDSTYPGLVYSEIQDAFPRKRSAAARGIEAEANTLRVRSEERTRFFREDEKALIQIGPQFLSANRLAPYESWGEFSEIIRTGYTAYRELVKPTGIERMSLRYVNRIQIEEEELDLSEYFNLGLRTGEDLPDSYFSFVAGLVSEFADGRDALQIQMTNAETDRDEAIGVLLDLQYSLRASHSVEPGEVFDWLDKAHAEIEKGFEGSIRDSLRTQFGETKVAN
jgi:uncharacterized protein (TIGR04255 family)